MELGGGGIQARKLEFLLGQAMAEGCDTLVVTGGVQSNFTRLTPPPPAQELGWHAKGFLRRWFPAIARFTRRMATSCSTVCLALAFIS